MSKYKAATSRSHAFTVCSHWGNGGDDELPGHAACWPPAPAGTGGAAAAPLPHANADFRFSNPTMSVDDAAAENPHWLVATLPKNLFAPDAANGGHAQAQCRARRAKAAVLCGPGLLRGRVTAALAEGCSPAAIAADVAADGDETVCHETIYQALYGGRLDVGARWGAASASRAASVPSGAA